MMNDLSAFRTTTPARVMIVEDEAIVALELCERLGEAGYDVCGTAGSAEEAVEIARRERPDVILMDVMLRGADDGIAAAQRIATFARTPVIYLTSFSDPTTVQRAATTGPYGYLTKPYQSNELTAAIEVARYKTLLEHGLRASELWFSSTLRCVADAVFAVGLDGRVRFANPAAERLVGRDARSMLGAALDELLHYDDGACARLDGVAGASVRPARRLRTAGGVIAVDESVAPIRDDDDRPIGMVCALRDVTERVEAELVVRRSEERFRAAFEFAPVGMALVAMDGTLLQTNSALQTLLALPNASAAPVRLQQFIAEGEMLDEWSRLRQLLADAKRPFTQYERRFRAGDGRTFWGSVNVSVLHGANSPSWYLYQVLDISERKADEGRLSRLASHDALTGLPNRVRFLDELQRRCEAVAHAGMAFGVLMVDLDGFKPVNDTHGHAAGDELLTLVGRRLRALLRASDYVARWGGDEFAIILGGVQGVAEGSIVAAKLVDGIAQPFQLAAAEARIGMSVGLALCPQDAADPQALLDQADAALYRAKRSGRGTVRASTPADRADARTAPEPPAPGRPGPTRPAAADVADADADAGDPSVPRSFRP